MKFEFLFDDPRHPQIHQMIETIVRGDACDIRLKKRYKLYYHFIRPLMPIKVRQALQRQNKGKADGKWYLPTDFMAALEEHIGSVEEAMQTQQLWPEQADFAFVLTHDVETADGVRQISRIADMEQELGFRSSWNLIPHKYKIDMGLVHDLKSRGFEIGIHGYNHDGKLFTSKENFDRRVASINEAIEKYGAVGFRSPMVHRQLEWMQQLNVEYDASCFDIDPLQATPGGVGMIWPFMAGKFVELPYTLPQDHTLSIAMGLNDDQIWREKLEFLIRRRGMAMMLTHPDYMIEQRHTNIYRGFLEHVRSTGNYWHGTPQQTAAWWRERTLQNTSNAVAAPAEIVRSTGFSR